MLRGRIGEQAVAAWAALGDEVAVKREIIRVVADIKLKPAAHKGDRRPFGRHRLDWRWKFGPHPRDSALRITRTAVPNAPGTAPVHVVGRAG